MAPTYYVVDYYSLIVFPNDGFPLSSGSFLSNGPPLGEDGNPLNNGPPLSNGALYGALRMYGALWE